jgi:hypothetical protein
MFQVLSLFDQKGIRRDQKRKSLSLMTVECLSLRDKPSFLAKRFTAIDGSFLATLGADTQVNSRGLWSARGLGILAFHH